MRRRFVLAGASVAAAAVVLAATAAMRDRGPDGVPEPPQGPSVVATFAARSYAPGERALLRLETHPRELQLQVFRAGGGASRTVRKDEMRGTAVTRAATYRRATRITVRIGDWPSGVYFARLAADDGRVGFAPFVLRPAALGEHRIAVVVGTFTWAAYNFRDVDHNGVGDTWYASPAVHFVDITRPFLNRGVPPHYRSYDAGFLHWFVHSGKEADFLSDEDLDTLSGDELARRYDLIVFASHEEYVTTHMFDAVTRFRDLGGNLAFLSANNFYYRVERVPHGLHGRDRFRDRGKQEAALIGTAYVDWYQERYANRPYVVVGASDEPWLFAGTGLRDGSRFGKYGIEIDARSRYSPRGTRVLARIPDIFGPGKTAEMTYYETPRGAKVFAAGTINFGGSAWFAVPARMLENVWTRLSRP